MTTYQLLYLRYLQAKRDLPHLDHDGLGPDHRALGLSDEEAARQREAAEREFYREV